MAKLNAAKNGLGPTARLLRACAIGAAVGLVCAIILSLVAAVAVDKFDLPQRSILPVSMAVLGVSSFIGGFLSGILNRRRALIVGALTAIFAFAIVFIASFFVPDESIGANILYKALVILIPALVGSIISVNLPRRD